MTKVLYGERLGRQGELRIGCSATIDKNAEKRCSPAAWTMGWCLLAAADPANQGAML
jgi:hypothetical protein